MIAAKNALIAWKDTTTMAATTCRARRTWRAASYSAQQLEVMKDYSRWQ
jgi:hypothetical protein